ncbi:MAG: hypothetical protein LBM05_01880 [Endomicrobium sp.]|jgi:hypothetical protein|nr:hypothetical protein [Endomicrobium sp.]
MLYDLIIGVNMRRVDNIQVFRRNHYYLLFDKKSKKSFTLGEKEYVFWESLDGRDVNEIKSSYSDYEKRELMSVFNKIGLLNNHTGHRKIEGRYKKAIWCPEFFLDKNIWITKIYWWIMIVGFVAIIPIFFLCDYNQMRRIITEYVSVKTGVVGVVFVIIALSFHELSHALIAKKSGAVVPEIGIMINFILPCAYTTVCDYGNIKTLEKKIWVALAGIGGNILLIAVGGYIFLFANNENIKFFCIEFIFANIIPIFGNINFFYRDDAYVIIESLLGIRGLKERAKKYLITNLKNCKTQKYKDENYLTKLVLIIYAVGAYINELLFPFIILFLLLSTYVRI